VGYDVYQEDNIMNKPFSLLLVVLSLLVVLAGVAAAPMEVRTVKLISVEYVPHKGPVFTFEVNGQVSRSDMRGALIVQGGGNYVLHCTKVGENTVKCNGSQKVSDVNVTVTFGGSTFWTYVPGAPELVETLTAETGYCYTIYDYDMEFVWQPYGTHCQEIPAAYDDVITYYNPVWEDEYDVVFMPAGPVCSGIFGDAYYYPLCEYIEIPN
jgi:hypothetical protein